MEVEAVDEGIVAELLVAEGTEAVKVNTVIAQLREEGETLSKNTFRIAPSALFESNLSSAPKKHKLSE
jgi:pyruvate/2-oxoglutarate dehydrogenase complex dihydrolipoamide acyltransferase (E2) component